MAEYTLYCFAQSGNAYKAALMLELGGASWEPRWVDFFNGETRTPAYRTAINEMGEVPVLIHGQERLTQSGVILDYLVTTLGVFGPRNESERREILRWILWDNHKFTSFVATYRFFKMFAPHLADEKVQAFFLSRFKGNLKVLDGHLVGREFVAADRLTTADLSLCGYLFFEDEIGIDFKAEWPAVAAWLQRIRAMPGWKHPYDLMPGHPLPAKA